MINPEHNYLPYKVAEKHAHGPTGKHLWFHYTVCWVQATLYLFLVTLPLLIIGLVVIAVALPFSSKWNTGRQFRDYPIYGDWIVERLPSWAWLWSNDVDGAQGDYRGEWAHICEGKHQSFWKKWEWLAIRNKVGNLRHTFLGGDVTKTELLDGQFLVDAHHPGYQLVRCGFWYGYYSIKDAGDKFRATRIGIKADPWMKFVDYNGSIHKNKGLTFRPFLKVSKP